MATLLTIAKIWKQSKCPLMNERMDKDNVARMCHAKLFIQEKRMKSCHLPQHGWSLSIMLSELSRQRKTNTV